MALKTIALQFQSFAVLLVILLMEAYRAKTVIIQLGFIRSFIAPLFSHGFETRTLMVQKMNASAFETCCFEKADSKALILNLYKIKCTLVSI